MTKITDEELEIEEEPLTFTLENVEKILAIRDHIHIKEGRLLSFAETLDYVIVDVGDKLGICEYFREQKKKGII